MSKTIKQLTETTTLNTYDLFHIVDVDNDQDKKIKAANLWSGKPYGELSVTANTTNDTPIAVSGTDYNITNGALTTTAGELKGFTHDSANGRLVYTGEEDITVLVNMSITAYMNAVGGSYLCAFSIFQDGAKITKAEFSDAFTGTGVAQFRNNSLTCILTMSQNSYIELYAANDTDTTDIMVYNLNMNVTCL